MMTLVHFANSKTISTGKDPAKILRGPEYQIVIPQCFTLQHPISPGRHLRCHPISLTKYDQQLLRFTSQLLRILSITNTEQGELIFEVARGTGSPKI
jgi:hypothetical protein